MKVIRIADAYKIVTLIPRILPNLDDVLVVKLRDEISDVTSIIEHTFDYNNNYFNLNLGEPDVSDFYQLHHKYELVIMRESTPIYRGKLQILSDTDSIQDFKQTIITNDILRF